MNGLILQARDWWAGRTPREHVLLAGLAALALVLVYVYGLALPLRAAAEAAEARHERAASDLAAVRRLAGEIGALKAAAGVRPGAAPVAATVVRTANEAGIVLARQEPGPAGDLSVWVESVDPARAFSWIARLNREQAVNVTSLEIQKAAEGNGLQLRATFAGAGG